MATATASANAPAKSESTGLAIKSDPRAIGFKRLFESDGFQNTLRQTLPKHIDSKRMIRVVLSAFQSQPKLLECTPESVMLSLLRAAACGLEPDGGPLGQGYLVPFWNNKARRLECQFIPGYRGLVKLARNSGEVADVWAEVVYDKDHFEYELGLDQKMKHKRNDDAADPGELKYAYAVARFRDGEKRFVVMNKREVLGIKARTQSKNKAGEIVGPWVDHEPEQWKKTAIRRLSKMLPLSVEVRTKFDSDPDDAPGGLTIDMPNLAALPMPDELQGTASDVEDGDGGEESSEDGGEELTIAQQLDKHFEGFTNRKLIEDRFEQLKPEPDLPGTELDLIAAKDRALAKLK